MGTKLGTPSAWPLETEPLISVREAARRLGLCRRTVYDLCSKGVLPHRRLFNAIRIRPEDVERLGEMDLDYIDENGKRPS